MSTPSWLQPLIASWKIKNYSHACNVNSLVAATANRELENKNYLLACDVNALVAAAANRELENKNYSLSGNIYTLVGRDRHSACFTIIIISSPVMSTPSLAVTTVGLLLTNSLPQCYALVAQPPLACF
jgi:hypothetical protein